MSVPNLPAPLFDFTGAVTTGGTAQLVIPAGVITSYLMIANLSANPLYFELGAPRGTAILSSGAVSSVTINNAGFGYTYPPIVQFIGGGGLGGSNNPVGVGAPGYPAPGQSINQFNAPQIFADNPAYILPGRVAKGLAVLAANAVTSVTITDGGAGYVTAPYVYMTNDPRDPIGSAKPSATSGIPLTSNGIFVMESSYITNLQLSVYGASTAQAFSVKAA